MNIAPDDLIRMARTGHEDGHDPAWMARVAPDRRTLDAMLKATDHAKAALQAHEEACWRDIARRYGIAI